MRMPDHVGSACSSQVDSVDDFAAFAPGPQSLERLGQDVGRFLVGATLLDVGEVRFVGLDLRWWGWIRTVEVRWQTASWAIPGLRDRGIRSECGPRFMTVRAVVRDVEARRGIAPLGLTHRSSAHPAATNGTSTSHVRSPSPFLAVDQSVSCESSDRPVVVSSQAPSL